MLDRVQRCWYHRHDPRADRRRLRLGRNPAQDVAHGKERALRGGHAGGPDHDPDHGVARPGADHAPRPAAGRDGRAGRDTPLGLPRRPRVHLCHLLREPTGLVRGGRHRPLRRPPRPRRRPPGLHTRSLGVLPDRAGRGPERGRDREPGPSRDRVHHRDRRRAVPGGGRGRPGPFGARGRRLRRLGRPGREAPAHDAAARHPRRPGPRHGHPVREGRDRPRAPRTLRPGRDGRRRRERRRGHARGGPRRPLSAAAGRAIGDGQGCRPAGRSRTSARSSGSRPALQTDRPKAYKR